MKLEYQIMLRQLYIDVIRDEFGEKADKVIGNGTTDLLGFNHFIREVGFALEMELDNLSCAFYEGE